MIIAHAFMSQGRDNVTHLRSVQAMGGLLSRERWGRGGGQGIAESTRQKINTGLPAIVLYCA